MKTKQKLSLFFIFIFMFQFFNFISLITSNKISVRDQARQILSFEKQNSSDKKSQKKNLTNKEAQKRGKPTLANDSISKALKKNIRITSKLGLNNYFGRKNSFNDSKNKFSKSYRKNYKIDKGNSFFRFKNRADNADKIKNIEVQKPKNDLGEISYEAILRENNSNDSFEQRTDGNEKEEENEDILNYFNHENDNNTVKLINNPNEMSSNNISIENYPNSLEVQFKNDFNRKHLNKSEQDFNNNSLYFIQKHSNKPSITKNEASSNDFNNYYDSESLFESKVLQHLFSQKKILNQNNHYYMIDDNTKQSKDKEIEAEDVDETPTGSSIEQARKILKSELDNKKDLIRQLETNASEVNIPNSLSYSKQSIKKRNKKLKKHKKNIKINKIRKSLFNNESSLANSTLSNLNSNHSNIDYNSNLTSNPQDELEKLLSIEDLDINMLQKKDVLKISKLGENKQTNSKDSANKQVNTSKNNLKSNEKVKEKSDLKQNNPDLKLEVISTMKVNSKDLEKNVDDYITRITNEFQVQLKDELEQYLRETQMTAKSNK